MLSSMMMAVMEIAMSLSQLDTLCGWVVGQATLHMETLTEEQVEGYWGRR